MESANDFCSLFPTPHRSAGYPGPSRIFVVEDDRDLEVPIRRALRDLDPSLEVEWFAEGTQVYWELCRRRCDLVIADIRLPGGTSGIRLWGLGRVFLPNVPFVLMSAMRADHWLQRAEAAPPPFLRKPFTMAEFKSCVASVLYPSP
jgi:DNA-binding NtrC family response regulator